MSEKFCQEEAPPTITSASDTKKSYFKPNHEDYVTALRLVSTPEYNWLSKTGSKMKTLRLATEHLKESIPKITVSGLEKMIDHALDDYMVWLKSGRNQHFDFEDSIDALETLKESADMSNRSYTHAHKRGGKRQRCDHMALEWEKLRVKSEKLLVEKRRLDIQEKFFSEHLADCEIVIFRHTNDDFDDSCQDE